MRVCDSGERPRCVLARPERTPAGQIGIAPVALNQFALITREQGSGTRVLIERFLKDRGLTPRVSMEMSSNESVKQAVIANLGISFVSLHTVGLEVAYDKVVVLDIDETPITRAWHVVALNGSAQSPAAEAFRYFVLEHGAQILNELHPNLAK